ncbi:acyl-CoA N-acyltransferase [Leucogyrophana mollusca]|uniref:Acyl-CoA N-acyltransferase n=1 Tax=Leucogyrophana mollusca TaxID=85980 RepID=A0ACB8B5R4_9AGAM|nr:acyl-CoA N-acyltransferase [Leucogyrophana mollusca]
MNVRPAKAGDLVNIQACNMQNLPENYSMRFWLYCALTWPQVSFVAEDHKGRIIGYVLSSIEGGGADDVPLYGHVNSLSVLRPHRRRGLAKRLMELSYEAMRTVYSAVYVELHVRVSNAGAIALYTKALGFSTVKVDKKYYGDGENAYIMRRKLKSSKRDR